MLKKTTLILTILLLLSNSLAWAKGLRAEDFFAGSQLALAKAAADGKVGELESLTAKGAQIDTPGRDGMTVLLWALNASSKPGFSWLLEHGANPNLIYTREGISTVSLAAMREDAWFLKQVLAHGGDVDSRNPLNGRTPIFEALAGNLPDNVRLLIAAGADLNTVDILGFTPPAEAAANQKYELVYEMLVAGADPTVKFPRSGKSLAWIVRHSTVPPGAPPYEWQLRVVAFLKDKGIDVAQAQ